MSKEIKLSADVLFELEETLNKPLFMGVPLGSTLGGIFGIHFYKGARNWGLLTVIKDSLKLIYHQFKPRTEQKNLPHTTGKVLVTLIKNHPRYTDLMLPVMQKLGPDRCIAVLGDESAINLLPDGIEYILIASLSFNRFKWFKEFYRKVFLWVYLLNRVLRDHGITKQIIPHILDTMIVNSQRILSYHHLLKQLCPSAIVTEYDRNQLASGLILTARSLNIRTFTMQHGVINPPYGYVPLLADKAFCWGKLSYDQWIAMGVESERLILTGNQRLSRTLDIDVTYIRRQLNVEDNKAIILYASSPIEWQFRKKQVKAFCEAFKDQNELIAVIRLHPSEKLSFYQEQLSSYPFVIFTEADSMTSDEALALADIIVCRDSGFGNDALVKHKPVIIFDVLNALLLNGQVLIEKAGCPYVQNSADLINTIIQIHDNPTLSLELHEKAEEFVRYQFSAFGNDALNRILQTIDIYIH